MNEYIPCKRRDPTAWEAIGRREEKERRKRERLERERRDEAERSREHARV